MLCESTKNCNVRFGTFLLFVIQTMNLVAVDRTGRMSSSTREHVSSIKSARISNTKSIGGRWNVHNFQSVESIGADKIGEKVNISPFANVQVQNYECFFARLTQLISLERVACGVHRILLHGKLSLNDASRRRNIELNQCKMNHTHM